MSSLLDDASRKLGAYMLKGWVMTDNVCPIAGCHMILMRSQDGSKSICVTHDTQDSPDPQPSRASSHSRPSTPKTHSRATTPPTPPLDDMAEPAFMLPPPSQETLRRREQSDLASRRIAQKMLQGYAMLGEECLNPECIGVPLIRPPRRNGTKDPHMECVICNRVYIQVVDSRGLSSLRLEQTSPLPRDTRPHTDVNPPSTSAARVGPSPDMKGKGSSSTTVIKPELSAASTTLDNVLAALDKSISIMSARLDTLSRGDPAYINPHLIGETASELTKLLDARQAARRELAASST